MTIRELRRGEGREAILAATIGVVAEGGIDAVTHRRVAAAAGVSPGSATHHFSSREDLLREALRFYLQLADGLLESLVEATRAIEPPVDRVRQLLRALVEHELADLPLLRAEYELLLFASRDESLAAAVQRWESRWVAFIAGALERGGAVRPIEAARTILNLVRGFELECLLDPSLDIGAFERRLDQLLAATP